MKKILLLSLLSSGFIFADASALYSKCIGCHGINGEKQALGKSAIIQDLNKEEIIKGLNGYKEGSLNKYGMGSLMKGQVISMSDKDIEEVAVYITKLK